MARMLASVEMDAPRYSEYGGREGSCMPRMENWLGDWTSPG